MKILVALKNEKDGKYKILYDSLMGLLSDDDRKTLKTDKIVATIEYGASGI